MKKLFFYLLAVIISLTIIYLFLLAFARADAIEQQATIAMLKAGGYI